MFRLTMACILVATAAFGLIDIAISHDSHIVLIVRPTGKLSIAQPPTLRISTGDKTLLFLPPHPNGFGFPAGAAFSQNLNI